ncbi:hypothetical protein BT63DRAFT_52979 [Microthyrium microscopicum]|uniref:Fork-head domain-containing protein n=1 Tax=Microthyrium microscopicum TaxID=703497 RepID=A0A6A6U2R6_9PEZI|nr:hypothetical protein BT63DRAFT_52979 [Microthyrium microscopicum]
MSSPEIMDTDSVALVDQPLNRSSVLYSTTSSPPEMATSMTMNDFQSLGTQTFSSSYPGDSDFWNATVEAMANEGSNYFENMNYSLDGSPRYNGLGSLSSSPSLFPPMSETVGTHSSIPRSYPNCLPIELFNNGLPLDSRHLQDTEVFQQSDIRLAVFPHTPVPQSSFSDHDQSSEYHNGFPSSQGEPNFEHHRSMTNSPQLPEDSPLKQEIAYHSREYSHAVTSNKEKQQTNYAKLLFKCLYEAPGHEMDLKSIYTWFQTNTDKPKANAGCKGWMNSVRHNLSMNRAFQKVPSNNDEDGRKSHLWGLSEEALRMGVTPTTRFRNKQPKKRKGNTNRVPKSLEKDSGTLRRSGRTAHRASLEEAEVVDSEPLLSYPSRYTMSNCASRGSPIPTMSYGRDPIGYKSAPYSPYSRMNSPVADYQLSSPASAHSALDSIHGQQHRATAVSSPARSEYQECDSGDNRLFYDSSDSLTDAASPLPQSFAELKPVSFGDIYMGGHDGLTGELYAIPH